LIINNFNWRLGLCCQQCSRLYKFYWALFIPIFCGWRAAVNVKNSNGYLGENQATAKDLVFEFTVKVAKFTAVGNF
jgi:hypothetical protein